MSRQVIDRSQLRRATMQRGKVYSGKPYDWGYYTAMNSTGSYDNNVAVSLLSNKYWFQLAYFVVFSSPSGFGRAHIKDGDTEVFPLMNGRSLVWDKNVRAAPVWQSTDHPRVYYEMPDTGHNYLTFGIGFWLTLK